MNQVKKYLVLVLILFADTANAMELVNTIEVSVQSQASGIDSTVQPAEIVEATSPEAKEFERLVQEALKSEKLSVTKRVGFGALRELVKLGTLGVTFAARLVAGELQAPDYILNSMLVLFYISFFSPVLSDLFIHKKDQSLASLQKLQKYIASLKPEQKKDIIDLFKTKYEDKLKNKIFQEKDSTRIKVGRGVMIAVDSLLPLLAMVYLIYNIPTVQVDKCYIADCVVLGPCALFDALAITYSTRNSTDRQKNCAMEKINAALK